MNTRQYAINGEEWPWPDTTDWSDIVNGLQLSTNIPISSPYRQHAWRYPVLPDCEFPARLESIRHTQLDSLVTDPPDDPDQPVEYTEAIVVGINRTYSQGQLTGVEIIFEVFVG